MLKAYATKKGVLLPGLSNDTVLAWWTALLINGDDRIHNHPEWGDPPTPPATAHIYSRIVTDGGTVVTVKAPAVFFDAVAAWCQAES